MSPYAHPRLQAQPGYEWALYESSTDKAADSMNGMLHTRAGLCVTPPTYPIDTFPPRKILPVLYHCQAGQMTYG